MQTSGNFSISKTVRTPVPKLSFSSVKDRVLGKSYELSLVFIGDKLSRRLNRTYRNKDKPTNILSFPVSSKSGEIFINLSRSGSFSTAHLFIHGLLHLKGMQHGVTMERREKAFLKTFRL